MRINHIGAKPAVCLTIHKPNLIGSADELEMGQYAVTRPSHARPVPVRPHVLQAHSLRVFHFFFLDTSVGEQERTHCCEIGHGHLAPATNCCGCSSPPLPSPPLHSLSRCTLRALPPPFHHRPSSQPHHISRLSPALLMRGLSLSVPMFCRHFHFASSTSSFGTHLSVSKRTHCM